MPVIAVMTMRTQYLGNVAQALKPEKATAGGFSRQECLLYVDNYQLTTNNENQ